MNLKFWQKPKPVSPEECGHKNTEVRSLVQLTHVPLVDGHHTAFLLMKCMKCGGMTGFPHENLKLAQEEGTPEAREQLSILAQVISNCGN